MKAKKEQAKRQIVLAIVRANIAAGQTDMEIAQDTRAPLALVQKLRAEYSEACGEDLVGVSNEAAFRTYLSFARANLRQLDGIATDMDTGPDTRIRAIKAKKDFMDGIFSRGMELGVLKRVPDRKEILTANLTGEALSVMLTEAIQSARRMVSDYNDGTFREIAERKRLSLTTEATVIDVANGQESEELDSDRASDRKRPVAPVQSPVRRAGILKRAGHPRSRL